MLQGADNDAEMATMRNVAGEIKGAEAAVKKAIELGIKELVIYYDYMGIEMWATGAWKRNKAGTIAYHEYIMSVKDKIKLTFVKVCVALLKEPSTNAYVLFSPDDFIPVIVFSPAIIFSPLINFSASSIALKLLYTAPGYPSTIALQSFQLKYIPGTFPFFTA